MAGRIILRAVVFLLLTLFFGIWLVPADKVISLLQLPPNVSLYNISGDLWTGRIAAVEVNGTRVRNIDWKITPLTMFFIKGASVYINDESLLTGSFGVDLMHLTQRTSLSEVNFVSSLEKIYPLFADKMPLPLKMNGSITGYFSELSVNSKGRLLLIDGNIDGKDISVEHPFEPGTVISAGTVEIKVNGNASDLKFAIDQNSEQFQFKGKAVLKNMNEITIDGMLTPKGAMPDSLQLLLPMLGKADSDGRIKVRFTEKL